MVQMYWKHVLCGFDRPHHHPLHLLLPPHRPICHSLFGYDRRDGWDASLVDLHLPSSSSSSSSTNRIPFSSASSRSVLGIIGTRRFLFPLVVVVVVVVFFFGSVGGSENFLSDFFDDFGRTVVVIVAVAVAVVMVGGIAPSDLDADGVRESAEPNDDFGRIRCSPFVFRSAVGTADLQRSRISSRSLTICGSANDRREVVRKRSIFFTYQRSAIRSRRCNRNLEEDRSERDWTWYPVVIVVSDNNEAWFDKRDREMYRNVHSVKRSLLIRTTGKIHSLPRIVNDPFLNGR